MNKNTKKEKKILNYFTLDKNVDEIFSNYIENNFINKSKLIEGLVIQYLRKNNINIDD